MLITGKYPPALFPYMHSMALELTGSKRGNTELPLCSDEGAEGERLLNDFIGMFLQRDCCACRLRWQQAACLLSCPQSLLELIRSMSLLSVQLFKMLLVSKPCHLVSSLDVH